MSYAVTTAIWEVLENRTLLAGEPWGFAAQLVGLDQVALNRPAINGTGQTVAVIDTGIDYTHPLLGGGFGPGYKVVGGYDFVDEDPDPMDTYGHGTRVAGVVAASEFVHEGRTYRGIAPNANLVALRIDAGNFPVPDERIESALKWVLDHRAEFGITAVNISFGYGHFAEEQVSPIFGDELASLAEANVFVAASSGNNGVGDPAGIQYPGADPSVFSVGSVDAFGTISEFSERNALLEMLAPGEAIPTTELTDSDPLSNDITVTSGTSFSSPMVAGTVALLRQIDPALTQGEIRSILHASASEIQDGDDEFGFTTDLKYPLLNIQRATALAESRRPGLLGSTSDIAPAGNINDLAYDEQGVLHFAYHDSLDTKLKYATRSTNGLWSNVTVIDEAAPYAGQYVSLAIDRMGRPAVAYFDGTNGDLKYAKFDGESWHTALIDNKGSTGLYPSLLFDSDDHPVISYYYKTGKDLKLARYDGAAWTISAVDVSDEVTHDAGRSTSIALDQDGLLGISYEHTRTGHLKFARENTDGSWTLRTVDSATLGVAWTSLRFSLTNRPVISYYDANPANLKFARYTNKMWVTETIAVKGAQGLYSDLLIDAQGRANILYFNRNANQTLLARRSNDGTWTTTPIADGGGRYIASTFDPQGRLTFSWFQTDNKLLHVSTLVV